MARNFRRNPKLSAIAEPNVTPLLDLAFALLIIFMITTPLLEQTIPLDLPKQSTSSAPGQTDLRHESLSILGSGQYHFEDRVLTYEELDAALRDLSAQLDPPILHIRAEGELSYQEVVTVLDLITRHNLSKISLDTSIGT